MRRYDFAAYGEASCIDDGVCERESEEASEYRIAVLD